MRHERDLTVDPERHGRSSRTRLGADTSRTNVGAHADTLAGVVSRLILVILLASGSGAIALVLAYLGVYGFTPWGLGAFTRTVGQIFDPLVLMALALKTLLFAASVATLAGTARLFGLLIAIEALMLVAEFLSGDNRVSMGRQSGCQILGDELESAGVLPLAILFELAHLVRQTVAADCLCRLLAKIATDLARVLPMPSFGPGLRKAPQEAWV